MLEWPLLDTSKFMAIIVQKFGGTSVGDTSRILCVANKIAATIKSGDKVVAVVSAMAGVTNQLVNYCASVSSLSDQSCFSEYDAALASGEIVTSALLALALQELNVASKSLFAWQIPISTDSNFANALIKTINGDMILECLAKGVTPIIAGFQGVDSHNRVTTMGRGGSDTTAAAVAASIRADRCDIYTDVNGVYTADPRLVRNAKKINTISYEEMLEFASVGAKVLHTRAVRIAMKYSVPMRVLSSFSGESGTFITNREKIMETPHVTGIAYNKNLSAVYIKFKKNTSIKNVLEEFSAQNIQIEMMYKSDDNGYDTAWVLQLSDVSKVEKIMLNTVDAYKFKNDIAVVSIVGFGVKHDSSLLSSVVSTLATYGIDCPFVVSSETKISVLLNEAEVEKTVKILHDLLL